MTIDTYRHLSCEDAKQNLKMEKGQGICDTQNWWCKSVQKVSSQLSWLFLCDSWWAGRQQIWPVAGTCLFCVFVQKTNWKFCSARKPSPSHELEPMCLVHFLAVDARAKPFLLALGFEFKACSKWLDWSSDFSWFGNEWLYNKKSVHSVEMCRVLLEAAVYLARELKIQGLQSAPELNGREAKVLNFDEAVEKWQQSCHAPTNGWPSSDVQIFQATSRYVVELPEGPKRLGQPKIVALWTPWNYTVPKSSNKHDNKAKLTTHKNMSRYSGRSKRSTW